MTKGKMPPPGARPWVWYKTFTRIVDDERLLLLNFEEQRHYMLIYCCKAAGIIDRHESDKDQLLTMIAGKLRVEKTVLELAVMRMWTAKLLHHNSLQPVDWDTDQVGAPTPGAARVAKCRAAKSAPKADPPKAPSTPLAWHGCIPANDIEFISSLFVTIEHMERDGEPDAQLVLDEIAGIARETEIKSYRALAIRLVNDARSGSFHPEYGKPISASRRRGIPVQIARQSSQHRYL